MNMENARQFVEDCGLFYEATGLGRTHGRVIGWLMICDPPHQTLDELADALQNSKSTISPVTRMLVQYGLIERISRPGERKDYYQMVEGFWINVVGRALEEFRAARALAERGLTLLDDAPEGQKRHVRQMYEMYGFFERRFPPLLDDWIAYQDELPGAPDNEASQG
ncbi:MAG: MarR family transcriptional regulator [Chloroflexi bacterium]|nr:MarR family transcriptional regulator [Chloroflexota bacterium]